jgi:class 3 adenylate cyclase
MRLRGCFVAFARRNAMIDGNAAACGARLRQSASGEARFNRWATFVREPETRGRARVRSWTGSAGSPPTSGCR